MLRNLNRGLKPKLGLAILALDMHMHSRLFPREEVEPEATLTKNRWTHRQNDTRNGVGVGELIASHSWSAVKLDLYGLKFYTMHVLRKPWVAPGLIKPPRAQRLPDVITIEEARRNFIALCAWPAATCTGAL